MKMYFYKGCEIIKKTNKYKIIIIFSMIAILFLTGYCLAKYDQINIFSFKSDVAVPVLELEGKESSKINSTNNEGYYDFIIKNYNEKNVSDVSQIYTIEVISNTNQNIKFELYRDEEQINLINNKTEEIYMAGIEKEEHSYKLKVTYEIEENLNSDVQEDVQIKVHSEQEKIR